MAERKTAGKRTRPPATSAAGRASAGFTDDEKAAMRTRARELRGGDADGETEVLAKIAEMQASDRALAERIHAIVKASAPGITPKTWYGMPAYAKGGSMICWFQPAQKFKSRYAMLGFSDKANLDEGAIWPVSYALTKLTAADAKRIGALVKRAAS
ncbi:MAG TPA: DUF1801 domain-containing protein [Candidatus Dormibacteraeota bacterium]